jgi:hypothetical protein
LADQVGQVLLQRLIDFLEDLARNRKGVGQRLTHADGLGSLSRKNERVFHDPLAWRRGDPTMGRKPPV